MSKRKAESESQGKAGADREAEFAVHLRALNEQFASWVKEQKASAPLELWTDGVEDYLQYAKKLTEDFKDVVKEAGQASAEAAAQPAAANGARREAGEEAPAAKKPAAGLFSFSAAPAAGLGKPPLGAGTAAGGGIFGALPSTGAVPAFGASSAPAFGASSAPAFGASSVPAFGAGSAPAFGGFGAGSAPAFGGFGAGTGSSLFTMSSAGTLGGSQQAEEEGDEEGEGEEQAAEPAVQLESEGVEILVKQRIKLMVCEDRKWKDKGAGTLTLRRATGEEAAGKRPYLVFTTDAGRVLVNAPLIPSMKPTVNPKMPSALLMFLISAVDGKEVKGNNMFKCDSHEERNKLRAAIEEHY